MVNSIAQKTQSWICCPVLGNIIPPIFWGWDCCYLPWSIWTKSILFGECVLFTAELQHQLDMISWTPCNGDVAIESWHFFLKPNMLDSRHSRTLSQMEASKSCDC